MVTIVDRLAARFRTIGVERMFGVPGGGSSLDLIEAAGRVGICFVLCRTETAAALMAAVSAELTGVPGVVTPDAPITTITAEDFLSCDGSV